MVFDESLERNRAKLKRIGVENSSSSSPFSSFFFFGSFESIFSFQQNSSFRFVHLYAFLEKNKEIFQFYLLLETWKFARQSLFYFFVWFLERDTHRLEYTRVFLGETDRKRNRSVTLPPRVLTKSIRARGCVYDALVSGPRRHKEAAARADGAAERASGRGGAPGRLRRE